MGPLQNTILFFHKVFPIFLVAITFFFRREARACLKNHFRNQEESTDCIVMHRRQRYERGKKRFSLVFHYRVWKRSSVFETQTWHSPQLKQGDSCFYHYCIGKYLTVLQCLTQCPHAGLYCSRMPYGTVFCLYAYCICSPFFRILMPAFISRSWTTWHSGHSQIRIRRFFTRGFWQPQQLQVWLLGYIVDTLQISFPYQTALYSSILKNFAQETLAMDLASSCIPPSFGSPLFL